MFTSFDIKRLTEAANLPEFEDKNILYPLLSKAERKNILKNNKNLVNRQIAASVEIQRIWRGYRTRKLIFSLVGSESDVSYGSLSTKSLSEEIAISKVVLTNRLSNDSPMNASQVKLNHELNDEICHDDISSEEYKLLSFQSFCAYVIQKWWREKISKIKAIEKKALQTAEENRLFNATRAAQIIQKTWRAYVDLRVFRYLKDLIDFRNKGDGRFMMKFINPREAALIDNSIGMHVRFRFGGVTFPPCIYYKIFTNNVADVCSFSPRNYKDYYTSPIPVKFIHSRRIDANCCHESKEGWYRRFENNGWRPVVDNILLSLKQNEILQEKSCQKFIFSHEKMIRKQEVATKRRKKKIRWMKKLYMMGVLKPKCETDINLDDNVCEQNSNNKMIDGKKDCQIKDLDDDFEGLLQWATALDYERYVEDWHFYGTSFIQDNFYDSCDDPLS
ncbi:protein MFI isoform X3 [Hydra vulgaris]|uniref:Protein MFI isoform X3 n=1 Tax=Hydra vulgaris TaxID=6087 RepID=A0ABM4BD91_HYDVU